MPMSSMCNALARYAAALLVAFGASVVSFCLVLPFSTRAGSIVIGFFGVFVGGLCLDRRRRLFGSFLLTVVGIGFYLQLWTRTQFQMNRFDWSDMTFPLLPGLAIGGILAAGVFAIWARTTANRPQGGRTNRSEPTNSHSNSPPQAAHSDGSP